MIGEVGTVAHCSHLDLAARLTAAGQRVDSCIFDAPYSAAVHVGHDGGTRYDGSAVERGDDAYGHRQKTRGIDYAPWSSDDVEAFVDAWSPLVRGWWVSITDHALAMTWQAEFRNAGLYAFAPLPMVEIGSRVRLVGDGPSSWTCWVVAARPRDGEWLTTWREGRRSRGEPCSLPGWYQYSGHGDREMMGGKRTDAMRDVVRDYSDPGGLVADPTCGSGTTLVAAKMSGRRWIGGDCDAAHVAIAQRRLDETTPCDARGTPIGGAKGKSEAICWGDDYAAPAARKAGA